MSLRDSINIGIDTEKRAIEFYTVALEKVDDFNARSLLELLISEEKKHLDALVKIDNEIKERDHAASASYEFKAEKIKNPLFEKNQLERITDTSSTVFEVLKTASDMEKKGYEFYTDLVNNTEDESVKSFLKELAEAEKYHLEFINLNIDSLYSTGYWFGEDQVRKEF